MRSGGSYALPGDVTLTLGPGTYVGDRVGAIHPPRVRPTMTKRERDKLMWAQLRECFATPTADGTTMQIAPRPVGKPPGGTDGGHRVKRIEIRVSAGELAALALDAARAGLTVPQYVRRVVLGCGIVDG